jgi:addiction module HigA family antidote
MKKLLPLISPGEILLEEYLKPLGVSQNRLARDIDVPVSRIAGIVRGTRAITADTALRLGAYFGTSAEMVAAETA